MHLVHPLRLDLGVNAGGGNNDLDTQSGTKKNFHSRKKSQFKGEKVSMLPANGQDHQNLRFRSLSWISLHPPPPLPQHFRRASVSEVRLELEHDVSCKPSSFQGYLRRNTNKKSRVTRREISEDNSVHMINNPEDGVQPNEQSIKII